MSPPKRGRTYNRTPAIVNEKSINEPVAIKPAKVVKKPAKVVKESAKIVKKTSKVVKKTSKVVTRTADKVLEQLEVEEKEDFLRRSQRVLSKKKGSNC